MGEVVDQIQLLKEQLENIRIKFLGRNSGLIPALGKEIVNIPKESRKEFGVLFNALKTDAENKILNMTNIIKEIEMQIMLGLMK